MNQPKSRLESIAPAQTAGMEDAVQVTGVSVVIPCFNEQEAIDNLESRLNELRFAAIDQEYEIELILVDDGSTDETWERLNNSFGNRPDCTLLRHDRNLGMMAAVMTGIGAASNSVVCSIDSDCTYDPLLVLELVPLLRGETALVTASPYHPNGQVLNVPGWRIGLSSMASWMYGRLLRNKLTCYTCACRAYQRDVVKDIELENTGFVGTTELAWRVDRDGWEIREVPATLNVRQFGQSKMRTISVMMRHFKMLLHITWQRIFTGNKKT